MGLYNFKAMFVAPILAGFKQHTIRAPRKHPDQPGDTIHCYYGLRTKHAKLIGRFPCVKLEEIEILEPGAVSRAQLLGTEIENRNGDLYRAAHLLHSTVSIDGLPLSPDEIEALARRDGFSSFHEMMKFWDGRLPFTGHIIHWRYDGQRRTVRRGQRSDP